MSDETKDEFKLFGSAEMQSARDRLGTALDGYGGKMSMGFNQLNTPAGVIPIPDPERLMQTLGMQQQVILDLRREVMILSSVLKHMSLGLDDESARSVSVMVSADLNSQADWLENAAKQRESAKSSLVLPQHLKNN